MLRTAVTLSLLSFAAARPARLAARADPTCQTGLEPAHPISLDPSVAASIVANEFESPRGIVLDSHNTKDEVVALLVVEARKGISAVIQGAADCEGWVKQDVVAQNDLTHGIQLTTAEQSEEVYLYASSADVLYRWTYSAADYSVTGEAETLVTGMLNDDHITRTLLLDDAGDYMYISRGSAENLDAGTVELNSGRSEIRRFAIAGGAAEGSGAAVIGNGQSVTYLDGELVSWGNRNGVGLSFDAQGQLWEVENSADQLSKEPYGDIHFDNPAEELNLLPLPTGDGSVAPNYGYPTCFTWWNLTSSNTSVPEDQAPAIGTQFSINDTVTDEQCNDQSLYVSPRLSFQAHSAPLDIKFYGTPVAAPADGGEGLSADWQGDAFVSFHGSWNRDPPTGYQVVRIPWGESEPEAAPDAGNGYVPVIYAPTLTDCPDGCIRPAGLTFDTKGRLFVTSDASGEIIMVTSA